MFEPRKDVRIAKTREVSDAELRRWRDPSERWGRDNRPGFYSITGEFIQLPESHQANVDDKAP